jgi:hypothetical protein
MSNELIPAPANSQFHPAPHEVPELLWNKIEPYFRKYKVAIRESKGQEAVEGPVVVWDVYKLLPGEARGKAQTKGPTHNRMLETLPDGNVQEELLQFFTVTYRYRVYSSSSAEANKIAWDIITLLPQAAGIVGRQDGIDGLTWNFMYMNSAEEDRLTNSSQDDFVVRNLYFMAQVPVITVRELPEFRTLIVNIQAGRKITSSGRVTRQADDNSRYYIPVDGGQKVVGIMTVYLLSSASGMPYPNMINQNVDYRIQKDENGILYIQWVEPYGNVPQVGEDFTVDYFVATTRTTYPNLSICPSI